jgi:hypothetical protein
MLETGHGKLLLVNDIGMLWMLQALFIFTPPCDSLYVAYKIMLFYVLMEQSFAVRKFGSPCVKCSQTLYA